MMIGDNSMAEINLRDFYPHHTDCIVEVSDEIVVTLRQAERTEANYIRRKYRNKAHYSLDVGDGIERDAFFPSLTPYEVCEKRWRDELLYAALDTLSDKQKRRVYAYYILGFSQTEIARVEHINRSAVSVSISAGLRRMEKFLGNFF